MCKLHRLADFEAECVKKHCDLLKVRDNARACGTGQDFRLSLPRHAKMIHGNFSQNIVLSATSGLINFSITVSVMTRVVLYEIHQLQH